MKLLSRAQESRHKKTKLLFAPAAALEASIDLCCDFLVGKSQINQQNQRQRVYVFDIFCGHICSALFL